MNNPFKPQFKHDCKACIFMGRSHKKFDMYFCPRDETGGTVVARYGNEPGEYSSSPVSMALASDVDPGEVDHHDALVKLAKKMLHEGYICLSVNHERIKAKLADDADWDEDEHTKHCSVCGEPQFEVPSGTTCKNGHGGAPAKEG